MSTESFIPADYTPPASGGGYTKLVDGANPLRILSNPFMLWVSWTDGKPSRVPFTQPKPAKGAGEKDSVKHAWGLIVWNYNEEKIEVFELDKQTVISALVAYAENPKWGHPKHYDIVINKSGTGKDTEYKLVVEPKTPVTQTIIDAYIANPIDLTQLLVEGGNCFLTPPAGAAAATPTATPAQAFEPAPAAAKKKDDMPF